MYVDDIVVTGKNSEELSKLKTYLATEFDIKDLGILWYFLNIEVVRSKQKIFVSQRKYIFYSTKQECWLVSLLILLLNKITGGVNAQ